MPTSKPLKPRAGSSRPLVLPAGLPRVQASFVEPMQPEMVDKLPTGDRVAAASFWRAAAGRLREQDEVGGEVADGSWLTHCSARGLA